MGILVGGGALRRNIIRHILPSILSPKLSLPPTAAFFTTTPTQPAPAAFFFNPNPPWTRVSFFSTSTSAGGLVFNSLIDTRFPKRRPGAKSRRKRASLKPPGPYAWVQYVPGEPIPRSRPNEGSVQGRKRKKRIAQRKAFILSEKKKRKAQWAEARKKRDMKRIEKKMAAVAREKAWAERLIELHKLEAEKKAAMAS